MMLMIRVDYLLLIIMTLGKITLIVKLIYFSFLLESKMKNIIHFGIFSFVYAGIISYSYWFNTSSFNFFFMLSSVKIGTENKGASNKIINFETHLNVIYS